MTLGLMQSTLLLFLTYDKCLYETKARCHLDGQHIDYVLFKFSMNFNSCLLYHINSTLNFLYVCIYFFNERRPAISWEVEIFAHGH